MKRKALVLAMISLLLSLLSGFSASPGESVLAEDLSETATTLLFMPYGDTEIFAYTDGNTHILKTDGSASCTTAYPASHILLRGQSVSAVSFMNDFTVIERYNADSLTQSDLIGIELSENNILDLDTDSFGRFYAVYNSEPDVLHIFDAAGSYAGEIACPVNILGMQVLGNQLYIFLPEQCLQVTLEQALPQTYTQAFTYSSSAVPFRMLNASTYISTDGIVYTTSGTAVTTADHYALSETTLAAGSDALFWAGNNNTVFRCSFSNEITAHYSLPGSVAALTDTAAVVRMGNQYLLIPYGDFTPLATSTPLPTAAPSASPSAKPSASPSFSSSPSPTPSPIPGVVVKGEYMYVPAGTTAAALRNSLPYKDIEICTASMTQASGKIRTGWVAVTSHTHYVLIVPGDVNSSGTVNSVDLRLMQQFLLGAQMPEEIQILAGDLNNNGSLDAADLVLLVKIMQ